MRETKNNSLFKEYWIALVLLVLTYAPAANAQSQYVPTNYDEPFRGQFHFSQQSGWMNDINGVWYQDGVYHLTYQADPFSLDGSRGEVLRYWGHASGTDLIHWTQLPTILDPGVNVPGECWSGSTVIDFDNTSGFGTAENPPIVTIYSATNNIGTCLAYSLDKGTTWVAYENNPVNVATTNAYDTRDPHVFWYEPTQKWVCVIFENGFTFYNSPDLKTWTKTSTFGNGWGYECPDMFELAVDGGAVKKYVLLRADGQYYIGNFNGSVFAPDAGGPYRMVYNEGFGGGFYASQTFFQKNFPGEKVVQMAWMLGLGPGNTAPWTHNATFPCEVKLKTFPEGIRATRNPVSEIDALYQSTQTWDGQVLQPGQNLFAGKFSKCFDLEVVLDVSNAKATEVNFQFANKSITYNVKAETLFEKKLRPVNNRVKIRFLVDWGELEVFGNEGEFSWVENYKFTPSDRFISMTSDDEIALVSARLSEVNRVWAGVPNNTYANDADPETVYDGNWTYAANEGGYYNYDCHVGTTAGSSVEYTFTGKQISWYGLKNNDLGMASVYIDNVLVQDDIDCYDTFRVVQQLFTKTDLTDEVHKIKVVLKGTKNPASNGIALVHDYFGFVSDYVDSPETRPTIIDDASKSTVYTGNWVAVNNDNVYYNNTCHYNRSATADFQLTFTGTQISWYGLKNNDLGFATVYIDDEIVADEIDCYGADRRVYLLFNKTGLPPGKHTIKVVATGIKNPASNGFALVHDYFAVFNTESPALSIAGNLKFGNVEKNGTATKTFVLANTGNSPVSVSGIDLPEGYSANWNAGELPSGANKEISVIFAPLELKSYTGEIKVNTPAGTVSAMVSGNGISETAASEIWHFIMYGQSLSTGHEAYLVSTENIAGNYMIGNQLWINYGNPDYSRLNPLRATVALGLSDLSESPLHGAVNHIRLKQKAEHPETNNRFLATSAGVSGQSIESLSKEAQLDALYNNYKTALHYGKKIADGDNCSIACPAVFWLQGEWNYTTEGNGMVQGSRPTADKDEYKALLVTLKNNMQNEVQTAYSQEEKPLFITYQAGAQYTRGTKLAIGMAQLEASNEHNDIVCAGPVYPMTDVGGHLDGNGYRWYGEMLGKVYYKTKILGEDFKPLQPKHLSKVAGEPKKIRVTFYVPVPPLVIDVNTLKREANYGFRLLVKNRVQTIADVQIVNDSVVEITAQNDIPEGVAAVCYGSVATQGNGNLRDSDPYQAFFNYENPDKKDESGNFVFPHGSKSSLIPPSGEPKDENGNVIYGRPYPLYNFCIAFFYEIPEGENEYTVPHWDNATSVTEVKKDEISIRQAGKSLFVTLSEIGRVSVELYGISGEKVRQFAKEYLLSGEKKEYSLHSVLPGIYIAKVISTNRVKSVKLIL